MSCMQALNDKNSFMSESMDRPEVTIEDAVLGFVSLDLIQGYVYSGYSNQHINSTKYLSTQLAFEFSRLVVLDQVTESRLEILESSYKNISWYVISKVVERKKRVTTEKDQPRLSELVFKFTFLGFFWISACRTYEGFFIAHYQLRRRTDL